MTHRIAILVALEGADAGLRRAIGAAEGQLNDLSAAADVAGDQASAGLGQIQTGASALAEQIATVRGQLLAWLSLDWAASQIPQIVQIADAWNLMIARLQLATAGQREFAVAQQALFDMAQRVGTPLQETATLYGKLQQATRMLGQSQQEALDLTESISQALRISGASAAEAESSLLQFGQALAAGVLRGEEFNSVVENGPRLAQALADGLNVPIGRLRVMAEEGRLTADVVVHALLGQKAALAAEYAQLPQTVSQAFERLRNAAGQWIHQLDAATGLTQRLAAAMNWLAQHLDTVSQWLKRLAEVGLAVLTYRAIPALVAAWQAAGAAAVTAATATRAAWATASLSVTEAAGRIGVLRTGLASLGALLVGWEIGSWLSEQFEGVRLTGTVMVEGLLKGFELLRWHWESFAALFTADTLGAAMTRHRARLAEMNQTLAEMRGQAAASTAAAGQAMGAAVATAEEVARQLRAVQQGTQEAAGRGVEAIDAAVSALQGRLNALTQEISQSSQVVSEATGRMAEAYQGLTQLAQAQLQQQIEAVKARYQQEQAALEQARLSEAQRLTQSTQQLAASLTEQATLRQRATTDALQQLADEAQARLEAARRQGQTEIERLANVQRTENEILATRRQLWSQAAADYRQHIEALNAEAHRHLNEIRRIEEARRLLSLSTEERIREIQRQGMSEVEAMADRRRQIDQWQQQARQALASGEFEQARQWAQKALDLAAQVASSQSSEARRATEARQQAERAWSEVVQLESQAREARRRMEYAQADSLEQQAAQRRAELTQKTREADAAVSQGKGEVKRAIDSLRESSDLLHRTLEAEGRAHQQAARSALTARDEIQQTLSQTDQALAAITAKLQQGLRLTLDLDRDRFDQALAELDRQLAEKTHLLAIQADLQAAEQQLRQYEQLLKAGQTLPVHADLSSARAALQALNDYAAQHAQFDLKVSTEKAQSAMTHLQGQLQALSRIQTESQHRVRSNIETARSQVLALQGMNTSSTHTISVRKVETRASGGLVGSGIRYLARGGAVAPGFPRQQAGLIPGTGDQDTVPRTLDAGAFVLRKAAVRKYGSGLLARLAGSVAHFATGGLAGEEAAAANPELPGKRNREVSELLKTIDLGLQGMRDYQLWLEWNYPGRLSLDASWDTLNSYGARAERDKRTLYGLLPRRQLTANERQLLDRMRQVWRQAMAQPLLWGKDLERDLLDYMDANQGAFYRGGGLARSDTVPAMLTPGEYVVNRAAVAHYGSGLFEAINHLALPARALAQRVQGYASGGLVAASAGTAARAGLWARRLPPEPDRPLLAALGAALQRPVVPRPEAPPPSRTVRLELALGRQTVAAQLDSQEEARLMDLLKQAQSRAL